MQSEKGGEQVNIKMIDDKRKEQRWTVTAFCESVGIDRTTYYKYLENPDVMSIGTWEKMVTLLNFTKAERTSCLK